MPRDCTAPHWFHSDEQSNSPCVVSRDYMENASKTKHKRSTRPTFGRYVRSPGSPGIEIEEIEISLSARPRKKAKKRTQSAII